MQQLTILTAALALAAPVFAVDQGAIFAKHWQTSKEFTLAVAEAMPAADYNFKPNDAEMSFGKVMTHIALNNIRAFATVSGLKPLDAPDKIAAAFKDPKGVFDKESTIQFLRDSFDFCAKAFAEITPEKLDAMAGPATGRERLWSCFTHTAHHRGQAEVYLRIKNIKPPDYRF
ncbi:MAG TPA: DinB family protein [Bryobacteraceae bacterium]|jgi:uncharacterized damage-inducible protein DinB|nr:DinB family protein [Bryobacteraceae bacterium]